MHDNEQWQLYAHNGLPVTGQGAPAMKFRSNPLLVRGTAHVWFWKQTQDGLEVLLQKRSRTRVKKPGMYHMSAGGHINVGENDVQAALRETKEEMGISLDANRLYFVATIRVVPTSPNDLSNIFLYELQDDEKIICNSDEVESYTWKNLDEFKEMTQRAGKHGLVDQGLIYFETLFTALRYVASDKDHTASDAKLKI